MSLNFGISEKRVKVVKESGHLQSTYKIQSDILKINQC
jgi:hypothetical protein